VGRRALDHAAACLVRAGVPIATATATALAAFVLPAGAGAAPPVTVTREPAHPAFGDVLRLRVDVRLDPEQIDPRTVHAGGFSPWVVIRREQSLSGRTLSVALRLVCLRPACLGKREGVERRFQLTGQLTWSGPGGVGAAPVSVPAFGVASRVTPAEKLAPRFRVRLRPLPRFVYRIGPATAANVAFAGAGLLALAGLGILVLAFAGRGVLERRRPRLSGLERALLIVRRAAAAGVPGERRRALDRLARELDATPAAHLGSRTRQLAWSEEVPEPAAVARVADDVEREAAAARGAEG
jgi:hypothetical protein